MVVIVAGNKVEDMDMAGVDGPVELPNISDHDAQACWAAELLGKQNYTEAAREADRVLKDIEPSLPALTHAALIKGKALLLRTLRNIGTTNKMPERETLEEISNTLRLAHKINPDDEETKELIGKMDMMMHQYPQPPAPEEVKDADVDVLVVGAGAAGIGVSMMLTGFFGIDRSRVLIVERSEVGASFRKWPEEMRFISPSFNQQGWTQSFDLNSISFNTSPAFSLHSEHPSGLEYAKYLNAISDSCQLRVMTNTEVKSIKDISPRKGLPFFEVVVEPKEGLGGTVKARYVVWAAGEFQYPRGGEKIVGSELCLHNSQVCSWSKLPGSEYVVVGGYESGVDACVNLAKANKQVRVLASTPCWSIQTADPSAELAPYTANRLREVMAQNFHGPKPVLMSNIRVTEVTVDDGPLGREFKVKGVWKKAKPVPRGPLRDLESIDEPTLQKEDSKVPGESVEVYTKNPPILCVGFKGSVRDAASHLFDFVGNTPEDDDLVFVGSVKDAAGHLFDSADDNTVEKPPAQKKDLGCLEGAPLLTDNDESTKVPGVFLVGPMVSHGSNSFCFVYKFRQRFAVVANAISQGLGCDTRAAVAKCREHNMYLDDLSCCGDSCGDVC